MPLRPSWLLYDPPLDALALYRSADLQEVRIACGIRGYLSQLVIFSIKEQRCLEVWKRVDSLFVAPPFELTQTEAKDSKRGRLAECSCMSISVGQLSTILNIYR